MTALKYPLLQTGHFAGHGHGQFRFKTGGLVKRGGETYLTLTRNFMRAYGGGTNWSEPENELYCPGGNDEVVRALVELEYHKLMLQEQNPQILIRFLEHHFFDHGFILEGERDDKGYPLAHRDGDRIYYRLVSHKGLEKTIPLHAVLEGGYNPRSPTLAEDEAVCGFAALDEYWNSPEFEALKLIELFRRQKVEVGRLPLPPSAAVAVPSSARKSRRL